MHRKFRQYLDTAEGYSEFIIVVVVDIREFSPFSRRHESPDTAMYIKKVYKRLIDDYFATASFQKPTGDGLLVTIRYAESTLKEVASNTIKSCLRCYEEFASICDNDPMINFSDVPTQVGIGIARGTACCLKSNDLILDYSGHILNLASRLMNLARPSGIVIDGDFVIELLDDEDQELFEEKEVYIRSIAEESPKIVYGLKDAVDIPFEHLQPLRREQWESIRYEYSMRRWKQIGGSYRIVLRNYLRRADAIRVTVTHPAKVGGRLDSRLVSHHSFKHFKYKEVAGEPRVIIDLGEMIKYLKSAKIPLSTKVKVSVDSLPKIVQ